MVLKPIALNGDYARGGCADLILVASAKYTKVGLWLGPYPLGQLIGMEPIGRNEDKNQPHERPYWSTENNEEGQYECGHVHTTDITANGAAMVEGKVSVRDEDKFENELDDTNDPPWDCTQKNGSITLKISNGNSNPKYTEAKRYVFVGP